MRVNHLLMVAAIVIAATNILQSAQAKTFTAREGYRISVPDDWTAKMGPLDPGSQSKIIFYYSTGKKKFPVVQVLTRFQGKMTMKFLAASADWMMQGTYAGFHRTEAGYTTLSGVPAYDIRGTYPRRNLTICVRQVFALRGGEAYMITTAYPSREGLAGESISNKILGSVRWN